MPRIPPLGMGKKRDVFIVDQRIAKRLCTPSSQVCILAGLLSFASFTRVFRTSPVQQSSPLHYPRVFVSNVRGSVNHVYL
jgi:hypothetical protein